MKKEITTQTPSSADTGRSMIEMLGTLAIMGVLSIGGIAGYNYAIDKYRANETMEELNKRAVVYATQILQNELVADTVLNDGEFGEVTTLGYDVSAVASEYENEFEIVLSNYPSEVCRDILKNYTVPLEIIIGNTRYNRGSDNVTICGEGTAPETVFVYAADLEGVSEETAYPYEGTYGACSPGVEFKSGSTCYPCDKTGHYVLSTEEEYSLCSACGRSVFQGGTNAGLKSYCVPTCRSGQVYHMKQQKCVTSPCRTNADCGLNSGKYCKLDVEQNGSSCTEAPLYGTCESASGTQKPVTGVGTYQSSEEAMNWWSAQNYCAALGNNSRMLTVADFGCADGVGWGYCNAVAGDRSNPSQTKSDRMIAFQKSGLPLRGYWTSDLYNMYPACNAYVVGMGNALVGSGNRGNYPYVFTLCRIGD